MLVEDDFAKIWSFTGSNIRTILLDSKVKVTPGVTNRGALRNFRVYETPPGQEWRLPLLVSLLEIRDSRWAIDFDEETMMMSDGDITEMIYDVCVSE